MLNKTIIGRMEILLIVFLLMPSITLSTGFGSYSKEDSITLYPGERGNFEILFFSSTGDSPRFSLKAVEYPLGFLITYPETFYLNSSFLHDEYIVRSGDYIKAKVVGVDVEVPAGSTPGQYRILLNVLAEGEKESNELSINLEKTFVLTVNVLDNTPEGRIKSIGGTEIRSEETQIGNKEVETGRSQQLMNESSGGTELQTPSGEDKKVSKPPITGMLSNPESINRLLSVFVLFGIGLIAIVIYIFRKKTNKPDGDMTYEELKKKYVGKYR